MALLIIYMIRHFSELRKDHIPMVGGKGANLGELFNAGFNVPPGFVVTTNAYMDFLARNELPDKISKRLKNLDVENTQYLDKVSAEIRGLIMKSQFPADLAKKIKDYTKKIGGKHYAVRSSATAEDLPTASFAGQQDTYLEIKPDKITEHVHKCFASLFTSRAIYYREKNNFPHTIGIAVVVQEMVDAEFAGVMFTIDPVFKKNLLIEIASGLGEKIVSGQITPNNYFIERNTFEILEKHEEEDVDEALVRKIGEQGLKIEKHYGSPQDIEFAVKKGKIYILQARPITTL